MSRWNPALGNTMITAAIDDSLAVNAERSKVKVGYAFSSNQQNITRASAILGDVETITCEVSWNRHQRMSDTLYQHQIVKGIFLLETNTFASVGDNAFGVRIIM